MNRQTSAKMSLLLFFLLLLINYLTANGSIPGLSPQKEISNLYDTVITPAGFAFSIWGVIYLLLFFAILYLNKIASDDHPLASIADKLTLPLWAMVSFNIAWNLVFGLGWIGISFLMIIGYWIFLIAIGHILVQSKAGLNMILPLAFGLHTGWISIASFVNLFAFLVKIRWDWLGLGQNLWAIFALIFIILVVWILQSQLKNAVLPIGTAWALFGIYAKNDLTFLEHNFVSVILITGIVLLIFLSVLTFVKNQNSLLPKQRA